MRARGREMYLRAGLDGGDGLNKQNTLYKHITIHFNYICINGGQTSIRVRVRHAVIRENMPNNI